MDREVMPLHICDSMFALEKVADAPVVATDLNK